MSSTTIAYTRENLRITMGRTTYVVFTVGMPLAMFLLFNQIYGREVDAGVREGGFIMVNMALYGALGAAQNSGATLQSERHSGWFRQLAVAGLGGNEFLFGKAVGSLALMVPGVLVVFAAGAVTGVHLSPTAWLLSALLIWVATAPMVLVGLDITLWCSDEAAGPVNSVVMTVLAILGGLWFPVQVFPHALLLVARCMPTYWIRALAGWPLTHQAFPWTGVAVLAAWSLVLALLAAGGFRSAIRTSRR